MDLLCVKGEMIFVVEDEDVVWCFVVDGLQEFGYKVVEVDGGLVGLILECYFEIKMVFIDIVMLNMNGCQLADEVIKCCFDFKVFYIMGYTCNVVVYNGSCIVTGKQIGRAHV